MVISIQIKLWHKQAIFESEGVQLSSSAECRIRSWEVSDTNSSADWMPTHKPTELSRIKLKISNSTARPYDEWYNIDTNLYGINIAMQFTQVWEFWVDFTPISVM